MTREAPELIPRRLLFSDPERSSLGISPDGSRLIWLAPLDGVLNIWIAPLDDAAEARVLTRDGDQGIHYCTWSYNDDLVLYLQDTDGDENWHLYE